MSDDRKPSARGTAEGFRDGVFALAQEFGQSPASSESPIVYLRRMLAAVQPAAPAQGEAEKRWPFVESPGEIANRVLFWLREYPGDASVLPALRYAIIECGTTIAAPPSVPAAQGVGRRVIGYTTVYDLDFPFAYASLGPQTTERCIAVYVDDAVQGEQAGGEQG